MVIYSDESDYESTWRRVDAMFDFRVGSHEPAPSLALWERENVWTSCTTIQRNYRTSTIECGGSREELYDIDSTRECREGTPEFQVPVECEQDYDQLVASIVQDIEENKIQLGPLSTEFVVAPTRIVYPKVR